MDRIPFRRRKKLVAPALQLRLVGAFVGLAALGLALQFLLLGGRLAKELAELPDGGMLALEIPGVMLEVLALSMLLVLPLIVGIGILMTFRVAGPIHRFEKYLRAVANGEETEPCRIRRGDELQGLCDAINEATAPLRAQRLPVRPRPGRPDGDSNKRLRLVS